MADGKTMRGGTLLGVAMLAASAFPAASQNLVFDGNWLFNNTTTYQVASGGPACLGGPAPYTVADLASVYFTHNRTTNPLVNPAATTLSGPRWDLQAGSQAHGRWGGQIVKASNFNAWFQDVCYAGAVDYVGGAATDWTTGWTYYNQVGGTGRTDINYGKPLVSVNANIAANTVWSNTNNYELVGRIAVQPGFTLTIQPGTTIFGNTAVLSYLVIERGAKINAQGTAAAPIVFTSGEALGLMAPADWGGIVINGRAVANCSGTISNRCGLTDATHQCAAEGDALSFYGEDNDADDSGILRYVRVEYAGFELAPNNELNAFTFNAVGSGTQIEYLEAFKGSDDLFEWFGGTARVRHLVGADGGDDGVDWQMGFRGFVQFAAITTAANNDKGIEADNNEFAFNCPGRSNPVIANCTFVSQANLLGSPGIHWRRGTAGTVINSIILNYPVGFRVEHPETFANCPGPVPALLTCETSDAGPDSRQDFVVSTGQNPSYGRTHIAFSVPNRERVNVQIFDAAGRAIVTLADQEFDAGSHTVPWDATDRAAGAYFYRVSAGAKSASGRLLVLK